MNVVPVLDLKDGLVVLASGGHRDAYRPVDTPLCHDPAPAAVIGALLDVFPFTTVYIADIDAITGAGTNALSIRELADASPDVVFWIDSGFNDVSDLASFAGRKNIRPVIGSESLTSLEHYTALAAGMPFTGHVLSLDCKDGQELGPPELIEQPELWPDTVISMDLNRVGADRGPNDARLRRLQACREDIAVAAAGGVRGLDDLRMLAAQGTDHVLIATALHEKKLVRSDIESIAR